MAKYPDSTKTSLEQRLRARARERWPQIASLQIRHRGTFSYVDAALADGTMLKLCRLRYVGSASQWQFAIYRASHDDYDESVFPTGLPVGTCQDALDTACGLYLNDPTAWIQPPTNLRARPLSWGKTRTVHASATVSPARSQEIYQRYAVALYRQALLNPDGPAHPGQRRARIHPREMAALLRVVLRRLTTPPPAAAEDRDQV